MTINILRDHAPATDPRLGRKIHHDSRSLNFPYDTTGLDIVSAVHARHIPILDQGQVGSCTGNAGIGALGCDPYWPEKLTEASPYALNEDGALALYSAAETLDGDGPYPPNDNGSSGLSIAQVLKAKGMVSGYTHTFTLDDALKALGQTPILIGIPWMQDMFNPDADGRLHPTGAVAGGHEIVAREIDAANERVWIDNSWGTSWGVEGRAYLTFADFGTLLAQQGDVTILTPLAAPEPAPAPPVPAPADPDAVLVAALGPWAAEHHTGANATAARAFVAWREAKHYQTGAGEGFFDRFFPGCRHHDEKLDEIIDGLNALAKALGIVIKKENKIMTDQAANQADVDAATTAIEGEVADLGAKDTAIQAVVTEILALQEQGVDTTALVTATADLLTAQGADDAQVAALTAAVTPPAAS